MKNFFLEPLILLATTIITFLLTRKKYSSEVDKLKADTDHSELDNVEQATRIWRTLSEELNVRLTADIKSLRQENEIIKSQFYKVFEENSNLKLQMMKLEAQLKAANETNERLLAELKKFNKNYTDPLINPNDVCNYPK